jgi:hypothetical protein
MVLSPLRVELSAVLFISCVHTVPKSSEEQKAIFRDPFLMWSFLMFALGPKRSELRFIMALLVTQRSLKK